MVRAQPAYPSLLAHLGLRLCLSSWVAGSPSFSARSTWGHLWDQKIQALWWWSGDRSANDAKVLSLADPHLKFLGIRNTWVSLVSPLSSSIYLFHNLHSTPNPISVQCQGHRRYTSRSFPQVV